MANKQFNSVDGYSVGNANIVIDSNGNVSGNRITATANVTAPQLVSNVANGTAPLVVTSTTKVANLNVEQVDGFDASQSATANTLAVRDANGNLTANFFIGNGSQLTGITATFPIANGNSNVDVPVANGNINFSVAGNANVLVVTGTGITTGTGTGGNISGANVISANLFTGTLTTAAQPNITSIGTLTGLTVNGNVTLNNTSSVFNANSSSDALRISQLGTGNAFVVEDSTNPDSTPFVVASDGNVSIGGTTPTNKLQVVIPDSAALGQGIELNTVGNTGYFRITGGWSGGFLPAFAGKASNNSGSFGYGMLFNALSGNASDTANGVITFSARDNAGTANVGSTQTAFAFRNYVSNLMVIMGSGNVGMGGNIAPAHTVSINGTLNASGNANVGNIGATRGVFTNIAGEGGNISNIQGGNVSGAVASATAATNASALLQNTSTATTVYPTFTTSSANGNSSAVINTSISANLSNASISATTFVGRLIGNVANGTTTISIPATNGNINLSPAGNANILVVTGTGANVTGTINATGNANVGNLGTAQVLATANIVAPQLISNAANGTAPFVVNSTTQVANLNVSTAGTAGTVTTNAQPNITSVGTLTSLDVTGNISANNITTTNKITAGNGLQVSSGALTVTNGNLDVTGNINVTGNLNYSNVTDLVVGDPLIYIGANNTGDTVDLGVVGSYNNGTYYHTGIARNATNDIWTFFDGVVAEPTTVIDWANATYPTVKAGNIQLTGNVTAPTLISNAATGTAPLAVTSTTRVSNLNVSYANVADFINVSAPGTGTGYVVFANTTSGNVAEWVSSGITSNLANNSITATTFVGTLSGAATTAGTVTTAAQPNITSVGTLTGLTAGNATANVILGNGTLALNEASGAAWIINAKTSGLTNDSGLYVDAANNFQFAARDGANTLRVVIDANSSASSYINAGKVGIGTTTPYSPFTVRGESTQILLDINSATDNTYSSIAWNGSNVDVTVQPTAEIRGYRAASGALGALAFHTRGSLTTSLERMRIDSSGNVGIANTAPAHTLSVTGTINVSGNANVGNIGAGIGVFTGNVNAPLFRGSNGTANAVTAVLTYGADVNFQFTTQNGPANNASGQEVARAGINYNGTGWDSFTQYVRGNGANTGWQILYAANTAVANVSSFGLSLLTGSFSGSAAGLTSIPGANVTGTVSSATTATTAGTVTTAAQPNITSVGTLTSLTSSGNISGANLVATAYQVASVNGAVSAAGTTQGTATVLAAQINVVSTVASGAGVQLPNVPAGIRVTIMNTSANALLVYPATGETINSLALNAAYSQPAGARLDYVSTSSTQWYTLNATYG